MTILSAVAVLGALFGIYRLWSKWPLDIIGVFCLDFMLFYGFRVFVVGFGIDGIYPDYLFTGDAPLVKTNLLILLFLATLAGGLFLGGLTNTRATWVFPSFSGVLSVQRGVKASVVLTFVSSALTLVLLAHYGGFAGLIRAGKLQGDLAGLFILRIIPGLGAVVSSATFLELVRRRSQRFSPNQRLLATMAAGMAILNGIWVFAWGARSLLAIVVFMLLAGYVVFRTHDKPRRVRRRQLWAGLIVVCLVAAGTIVGLRIVRDLTSRGVVNTSIAGQSAVRQVSVASNATYYDAFVLAVRDWPSVYEYRNGSDFYAGAVAIVPRAVWHGKPSDTTPGQWFRQIYEPTVLNGWPMGTAGEWYLNFGILGVIVGGLVSGLCLSFASRSLRDGASNPMVFVTTLIIGLQVLEIGFNTQTPVRWVAWCLPILLISPFLRLHRQAAPQSSLPVVDHAT